MTDRWVVVNFFLGVAFRQVIHEVVLGAPARRYEYTLSSVKNPRGWGVVFHEQYFETFEEAQAFAEEDRVRLLKGESAWTHKRAWTGTK